LQTQGVDHHNGVGRGIDGNAEVITEEEKLWSRTGGDAAIPVMGLVVTTSVVYAAQPATKVATTMPYHGATMLKRELLWPVKPYLHLSYSDNREPLTSCKSPGELAASVLGRAESIFSLALDL